MPDIARTGGRRRKRLGIGAEQSGCAAHKARPVQQNDARACRRRPPDELASRQTRRTRRVTILSQSDSFLDRADGTQERCRRVHRSECDARLEHRGQGITMGCAFGSQNRSGRRPRGGSPRGGPGQEPCRRQRFVRGARAARLERRRQDREDVRAALLPRGDRAPTDGCPCLQQRRRRHRPGAHTGRDQTQRTRTTEPFIRQSRASQATGRRRPRTSPVGLDRRVRTRAGRHHVGRAGGTPALCPGRLPAQLGQLSALSATTPDGDRQRASLESARSTPAQQLPFTVTPC